MAPGKADARSWRVAGFAVRQGYGASAYSA